MVCKWEWACWPVSLSPCATHGLPLASSRPELIDGCFQLNQVIKLTWEQLSLLTFAKTLSDSSIFQLILILLYWLWVILVASWKDSLDFLENLNIFFLNLLIPWIFLLHYHSAHTYCKVSPHLPVNSDLHGSQTLCFKGLAWLSDRDSCVTVKLAFLTRCDQLNAIWCIYWDYSQANQNIYTRYRLLMLYPPLTCQHLHLSCDHVHISCKPNFV